MSEVSCSIVKQLSDMNYLKVTIICRYIFCGFGILCILLVLNFEWASQLMIFMMVLFAILILIFTSIKFCALV